jgi:hypothetical protein
MTVSAGRAASVLTMMTTAIAIGVCSGIVTAIATGIVIVIVTAIVIATATVGTVPASARSWCAIDGTLGGLKSPAICR